MCNACKYTEKQSRAPLLACSDPITAARAQEDRQMKNLFIHTNNVCFCCRTDGRKPNGPKSFTVEDSAGNEIVSATSWPGEGSKLEKLIEGLVGPFHQICRTDGAHSYVIEVRS